jgi:predicted peroxiredoxin
MYVCTDSMELNDVTREDLLEGVELAGSPRCGDADEAVSF